MEDLVSKGIEPTTPGRKPDEFIYSVLTSLLIIFILCYFSLLFEKKKPN